MGAPLALRTGAIPTRMSAEPLRGHRDRPGLCGRRGLPGAPARLPGAPGVAWATSPRPSGQGGVPRIAGQWRRLREAGGAWPWLPRGIHAAHGRVILLQRGQGGPDELSEVGVGWNGVLPERSERFRSMAFVMSRCAVKSAARRLRGNATSVRWSGPRLVSRILSARSASGIASSYLPALYKRIPSWSRRSASSRLVDGVASW